MRVRSSVRVGDLILVMGIVGRDESGQVVEGVVPQTIRSLERIKGILAEHGCDLSAIVRLRVYLTDIADWPNVRDELSRALGSEWPPALVVEVGALVEPAMFVEFEVDATAR